MFETDFMPHGHCYFWKPAVLWTNVLGDAVIAIAYFTIPLLLIHFLKKRPDVKFRSVFYAFAAFILACGTTHVIDIISVWHPMYRLEGLVKIITAIISGGTVIALAYLLPRIVNIPTPEQWKDAKSAAEMSERRFMILIEQAPVGVAITDAEGNFSQVNEAMCNMFKRTEAEFYNLSFKDITHPDDMNMSLQAKDHLAKGIASHLQFEKRYLRKDGSYFWGLISVTHIPEERCNVVHIQDITERKQAEQRVKADNQMLNSQIRQRNSELRDINKDLENFIFAVTHDLRVPLHNLRGLSAVVEEEIGGLQDKHEAATAVQMIGENAERIDNLLTDLLAFSRTTKLALNKTQFDIEPIVRAAFNEQSSIYSDLTIKFKLGALPTAFGDPSAISQVCQNLIANALKFASRKPEVNLEISGEIKDGMAIYRFEDNGIGFDPQYSSKLFQPFQRLHLNDEYEGTGIGLATSYRIVQKHGGEMWAEGRPGEGAIFCFSLPTKERDIK